MNRKNIHNQIKYRIARNKASEVVITIYSFLITIPLIAIIFYVLKTGLSKLSWQFLTNIPQPVGELGGGIANALVGSILIVLLATIIAVPFGILCGVYLSENKNAKLSYWSRLAVDVLQGTPSIVIGIVIYFWVVKPRGGFSAFSGSIALALMMLPIVIRSTEETLKLLPDTLKEAGLALGLPYHKVILKVIIPCGVSGILSGVMLSIARIAGETAPLLFTAFGNPYLTTNVLKPMQTLPLLIFNYATSPYDEWHDLAWGASLILLIWVLAMNLITKLITRRWKVQL
ncbi:phosphate ABC transporter permease PstA [Flavisolibacter ginsengisoli]|jgi:phosphate transport system permease protein|uniref:Phosphate transport system permease protein PstA n=1 Tax=Flavisolibacter ginsengisoli DSM 18119 TaxID=1121884 RepID=A0A1M4SLR6_9BACT|nr:phosphate ABC transporter permease PstA [Flavisolibacter ginsengisoli]SHE33183.1 phosphate transport system permease protein [Flavisolibacter ginsengisoli DSM 18119]